jgi:hypothetical protein
VVSLLVRILLSQLAAGVACSCRWPEFPEALL